MKSVRKWRGVYEQSGTDAGCFCRPGTGPGPRGFWFHYPQGLSLEERAQAHVDLCRSVGTDIIKIMDDNFGRFFTQGIRIEKRRIGGISACRGRTAPTTGI